MQTQVYIEQVFIDNFLLTFILLLSSFHIIKLFYSKKLILLASVISGILTLLFPLVQLTGVLLIITKLSVGYILVFVSGIKHNAKQIVKLYIAFLFSTFFYAGIYFAIYYSLNIGFIPIGFFSVFVFISVKLCLKILKKYSVPVFNDNAFNCELVLKNKIIKFCAFLDTGNMLEDDKTNLPIMVVQFKTISQVLTTKEKLELLSCSSNSNVFNSLHKTQYSHVGGSSNLITFKPEQMYVCIKGKKTKVNCMVGVSQMQLFSLSNCQAIFGSRVLNFCGG